MVHKDADTVERSLVSADPERHDPSKGNTGLIQRLCSVDVTEVFSPPRLNVEADKFCLKPCEAWDLTNGWDFRLKAHRDAAETMRRRNHWSLLEVLPAPHSVSCRR